MAVGTEKLEQSDLAEVLLTVTEAAVEYFKPPEEKLNKTDNDDPLWCKLRWIESGESVTPSRREGQR